MTKKLTIEVNIAAKAFNQFADLDQWLTICTDLIAKQTDLLLLPIGNIGLLLTDDAQIRQLNRDFRKQDKATNVLSFIADKDPFDALYSDEVEPEYLGDIAMAYETLVREANQQNKGIKQHFMHLLIHSILHLLGYDHINDTDAQLMEGLEIKLLSKIDIENPYQNTNINLNPS